LMSSSRPRSSRPRAASTHVRLRHSWRITYFHFKTLLSYGFSNFQFDFHPSYSSTLFRLESYFFF
jgi:hypothetical protein